MSLRLQLMELAERQALSRSCPPAHLATIRANKHRLMLELAGNPMPNPVPAKLDPERRFQQTLNAMANRPFLKTPKFQQQQKRALREGAHPHIVEFADKLVARLAKLGIPVFPHCIVRTRDEQASAFVRGVTKDSPEDGLWPHMAFAVDIIHGILAWDMTPQMWAVIGHIGKEVASSMGIKIVWGGDWKRFPDPAHFELQDWRTIARQGDKFWAPIRR